MHNSQEVNMNMDFHRTLPAVLKTYIPQKLLQDIPAGKFAKSLELIQFCLDNSKNKLRMYGTAQELLNDLKVYTHFPLSRKLFPLPMGHYNHTIPGSYRNLKGDLLYCKQDFLLHLQSSVYAEIPKETRPSKLVEYMKNHAKRLDGCYEFIRYDKEIFEKIQNFFIYSAPLYDMPLDTKVTVTIERIEIEQYDFVKVFDELISEYPCIFLPNSETKDKNALAVVRIFVDGDEKFVMESELFNAINLKNPNRKPLECKDRNGFLKAIDMKHVMKTFRDGITDIDFIKYPVSQTEHAATPIPTPTGDHCILAADALYEILSRSVQALNVFQKVKRNTWNVVPRFIDFLKRHFPSDMKHRCFMRLDVLKKIENELEEFWKPFEAKPAKPVRDVGPNGFTAEDLKKELKYLGYTDIFPEITKKASFGILSVINQRNMSDLTTKDMFIAIEVCLNAVIFERFPSLQQFMLSQKHCVHQQMIPCDNCKKSFEDFDKEVEAEMKECELNWLEENGISSDGVENQVPIPSSEIEGEVCIESSNEVQEEEEKKDALDNLLEKMMEACKDKIGRDLEANYSKLYKEKNDEIEKLKQSLTEETKKIDSVQKQLMETKEFNEKLSEEKKQIAATNKKVLKEKNDRISALESENSKLAEEKKQEIETLKKNQSLVIKESKKEMEELKRNADKSSEEIKKLNAKIEDCRIHEVSIICAHEELIKQTNEVEREKDKVIRNLQKSNSEHVKVVQGLQTTISSMSAHYKDQGKIVEQLLTQLSSMTIPLKSEDPNIQALQKIKDDFSVENGPLKLAKDMVEKLRKTRPDLHQMANYEYQQYEGKVQNYLQKVEENIQKLKNSDCSSSKLPEFPSFSDRFIEEYWKEIDPKEDSECLICFFEMKSEEETLECEHCKKIVHMDCASKWLKIHRSCPHCRREQLDPNEFPALG